MARLDPAIHAVAVPLAETVGTAGGHGRPVTPRLSLSSWHGWPGQARPSRREGGEDVPDVIGEGPPKAVEGAPRHPSVPPLTCCLPNAIHRFVVTLHYLRCRNPQCRDSALRQPGIAPFVMCRLVVGANCSRRFSTSRCAIASVSATLDGAPRQRTPRQTFDRFSHRCPTPEPIPW